MWTKTNSRITIVTENSKPGISKYFLFGVSTLILTLCFAFATIKYAKYGSLDVGLPFFIFVGILVIIKKKKKGDHNSIYQPLCPRAAR